MEGGGELKPFEMEEFTSDDNDNNYNYYTAKDYDYLFKVVLLGDSGVGKTNLLSRFAHGEFNPAFKSTFFMNIETSRIPVDDKIVNALIWDMLGLDHRHAASMSAYYIGAVGALIVYDITRRYTYEDIQRYLKEVRDHLDPNIVIMLVGNKVDLGHLRVVSTEDAQAFAKRENLLFMETSALDNINVDNSIGEVVFQAYLKTLKGEGDQVPAVIDQGCSKKITGVIFSLSVIFFLYI